MDAEADVDLLFLSRDLSPPRDDVRAGIEAQGGVRLKVSRVVGARHPEDRDRCETIARARNAGKRMGSARWVMLLDDDVVLGDRCVARLVEALRGRPDFAAMAADCAGEMRRGLGHPDYPRHVGMASILFRRECLEAITFRCEPGKCECRCCCDDLRRAGFAIGYLPGAEAWHRPSPMHAHGAATAVAPVDVDDPGPSGRILAAFDRRHSSLFARRFLATLRASGNRETVSAVAYGVFPSVRNVLARMPGVDLIASRNDGHPARRRLRDFAAVVARWPGDTPVAYWDAGDVVFQDRVAPLWDLIRADPDRLLVAREKLEFHESPVVIAWAESIADLEARRQALDLLMRRPVLNSGFAAGTARTLLRYFRAADRLRHSTALRGSTDWGDQTALNLYCYTNPGAWREVARGWNYCLVGLGTRDFRVNPDGRTESRDGTPVHVVHGNGGTFGPRTLACLVPG